MVPGGRARSEFSRGPHVSKFFSFDFDLCVWMEGEASLPLLPLKHLYTCSTCVCAGCSMAVCPFCHICHKMLFPLLLEGILFRGELCCALLFLSCLKSIAEEVTEINLDILVLNFLDLDLPNHFNHTIAVTSLHGDLSEQKEGHSWSPGRHRDRVVAPVDQVFLVVNTNLRESDS